MPSLHTSLYISAARKTERGPALRSKAAATDFLAFCFQPPPKAPTRRVTRFTAEQILRHVVTSSACEVLLVALDCCVLGQERVGLSRSVLRKAVLGVNRRCARLTPDRCAFSPAHARAPSAKMVFFPTVSGPSLPLVALLWRPRQSHLRANRPTMAKVRP